jgi:hypothetical protein
LLLGSHRRYSVIVPDTRRYGDFGRAIQSLMNRVRRSENSFPLDGTPIANLLKQVKQMKKITLALSLILALSAMAVLNRR